LYVHEALFSGKQTQNFKNSGLWVVFFLLTLQHSKNYSNFAGNKNKKPKAVTLCHAVCRLPSKSFLGLIQVQYLV